MYNLPRYRVKNLKTGASHTYKNGTEKEYTKTEGAKGAAVKLNSTLRTPVWVVEKI